MLDLTTPALEETCVVHRLRRRKDAVSGPKHHMALYKLNKHAALDIETDEERSLAAYVDGVKPLEQAR